MGDTWSLEFYQDGHKLKSFPSSDRRSSDDLFGSLTKGAVILLIGKVEGFDKNKEIVMKHCLHSLTKGKVLLKSKVLS